MSKEYRDRLEKGEEINMRMYCQRPGKRNEEGKLIYYTEQHHKAECDVNNIIKKYDKTGLITHVSRFEAKFGDMRGVDFKTAMDIVSSAKSEFNKLPSEIRKRFENTPEKLLEFMEKEENRDEAIKLGLIRADWTVETDGLGEHVEEGQNVKEKKEEVTEEVVTE